MWADAEPGSSAPPPAYGSAVEPPPGEYGQTAGGYPPPQPAPDAYQQAQSSGGYYPQQSWVYVQPTYRSSTGGDAQQVYYPGQLGAYQQPPLSATAAPPTEPVTRLDLEDAGSSADERGKGEDLAGFTDKSIRLGFVRRVFGILAVQMVITTGIMCMFLFWTDLKEYSKENRWMYITALCLYFIFILILGCVGDIRRKWPVNLILLLLVTLCMAWMLGSIASHFETEEVLMAVCIVVIVTIVCSLLGFQNKVDFTWMTGLLVVLLVSLLSFGLLCAIVRSEYLSLFYAFLGAFLFSLWLVVDIQLIMGGRGKKIAIDPEEYIFAALNIYLDIVQILLYLLLIIGLAKS